LAKLKNRKIYGKH